VIAEELPPTQPHRQHLQSERERRLGSKGQQHRDNDRAVRGRRDLREQAEGLPDRFPDNGTPSDADFIVYAICGHKPAGYQFTSDSSSLGPGVLEDGLVCPAGTSVLDGGVQVLDHVPAVQVSGSIDQGPSGWSIAVNNTGQSTIQVDGHVTCAA
jgi:hypothetical protein